MKKVTVLFLATIATMIFVGCKKDTQVVKLGVKVERPSYDGKVYLNGNIPFFEAGDQINVNGTDYPVKINGTRTYVEADADESHNYYALFPASLGSCSSTSYTIHLPHWQEYKTTTVNGEIVQKIDLPVAAKLNTSDGNVLQFYNLCSLLKVEWTNTSTTTDYTITGIDVTATNGTEGVTLYGTGAVDFSGNTPTLTMSTNEKHNNRVFLDIPEGNQQNVVVHGATSNPYYIVLPQFTSAKVSVNIHVKNADNQKVESIRLNTNSNVYLNSAEIIPMSYSGVPKQDNELTGYFSVSNNLKVVFSRGNLQHWGGTDYTTGTWKFADRQYDFFGDFNLSNGGYYRTDYTDLFTWSNSRSNDYGIHSYDAWDDNVTWLSGGNWREWGNMPIQTNASSTSTTGESNVWFTLTAAEWNYLINLRVPVNETPKAPQLRGRAHIYGIINHPSGNNVTEVDGFILLPDDWETEDLPSGLSFDPDDINEYDQAEWARMEAAGAMFLPAAGWTEPWGDDGYAVVNMYEDGAYWSSTRLGSGNTTIESQYLSFNYPRDQFLFIDESGYSSQWYCSRSVRLVKAAPGYTVTGRWQ